TLTSIFIGASPSFEVFLGHPLFKGKAPFFLALKILHKTFYTTMRTEWNGTVSKSSSNPHWRRGINPACF
ncbi:MAG: hypothetical protein WHX93_05990, partial [bacterium]